MNCLGVDGSKDRSFRKKGTDELVNLKAGNIKITYTASSQASDCRSNTVRLAIIWGRQGNAGREHPSGVHLAKWVSCTSSRTIFKRRFAFKFRAVHERLLDG